MADGNGMVAHTPANVCVARTARPRDYAAVSGFKDGLAALASGVAIVACWWEGRPHGLLVNSLTGLSTEPPRILFCVQKAASTHAALLHTSVVSLSILSSEQQLEAERFSRTDHRAQRFGPAWRLDPDTPPQLKDALVALRGTVHCRIDAGTHTVLILDVNETCARVGSPLLYFERGYGSLVRT